MKISIIIPTRNRYQNLINTVRALVNQSASKNDYEIIISDDNSSDETFNVYKEISTQVKAKYINNNTKPHTWNASIPRNLGALVSDPSTKAYLFVDSDVVLPAHTIQTYLEDLEANPKRVVIGSYDFMSKNGEQIMIEDVRHLKFETVKPEETFDTIHDGLACFGGNILIPKDIFWSVGGFSPEIHIGLEDGDMGLKLWKTKTLFSYDNRVKGKHQWHEIPTDRFPSDMKDHVDNLNKKHFGMSTSEVDKNMDLISATRETYAKWGITGWEPPAEWLKMGFSMKINKE